ncbi:GNAT family N-acetyltransferase [Qipengyuania spongiae]|uniref:GNAT family N-acetyltransferase n=1 Tax=Qipengyuania spongiae TaxID=2909673 RepID=A0ABY5T1V9_9SPHN|nr:GNAT family N-acetyltransferase [Qipengyuania spongiae]UVI40555.1 GNAT family N-acetyltransferase [Qipengyuania spongiae]
MSGDWSLRLARPGDAEGFAAIAREFGQSYTPGAISTSAQDSEYFRRLIARRQSLTAIIGEKVVGLAVASPHRRELHLRALCVDPPNQRRGIGSRLLSALTIDARNCGMDAIVVEVAPEPEWLAAFYAARGFVEIRDAEQRAGLAKGAEETEGPPLLPMIRFLG